jgi:hypothetical protein
MFREFGISPEEANQRDLDESRLLMAQAYREAVEQVARRHDVRVTLESKEFVPDEIAGSRQGSAVGVAYDLVSLVIDSGLPADVIANVIADVLVFGAKEFFALARSRGIEQNREDFSHLVSWGIYGLCVRHALKLNPGSEVAHAEILKNPSSTSISESVVVVTVGLTGKEITYIIGRNSEPYAIVESTTQEIRLLSSDEWRQWYLSSEKS